MEIFTSTKTIVYSTFKHVLINCLDSFGSIQKEIFFLRNVNKIEKVSVEYLYSFYLSLGFFKSTILHKIKIYAINSKTIFLVISNLLKAF